MTQVSLVTLARILAILVALASVGSANAQVTCDNATRKCVTPVRQVNQDSVGRVQLHLTFLMPSGLLVIEPVRGVEIEGGGAQHHVHVFIGDDRTRFDCEWFARKRLGGDNGLAKGYCEVSF